MDYKTNYVAILKLLTTIMSKFFGENRNGKNLGELRNTKILSKKNSQFWLHVSQLGFAGN
jgi:hypothetical protein